MSSPAEDILTNAFVGALQNRFSKSIAEADARALCEGLGLALQGSLLVRHAPAFVADAFCAGRLAGEGRCYGTLPAGVDLDALIERARPQA